MWMSSDDRLPKFDQSSFEEDIELTGCGGD